MTNFQANKHILQLDWNARHAMAILNVTPDSFYSGSRREDEQAMRSFVSKAIQDGATIIDIGGYSSRPNAEDVSAQEEWQRVRRAIKITRDLAPEIAISLDTFRSEVARRAVEEFGELIINDITAGEADDGMIDLVSEFKLPYIAMHMRGKPQTMQQLTDYEDVAKEVKEYFKKRIEELRSRNVEQIIIDPGFGFAKTLEQNYELLAALSSLLELGCPILVGVSRKSMIYKVLDNEPKDALAGTIALGWEALRQGASILRVHDVKEATDTIKIFEKFKSQIKGK